jgi:hypothetical protein
MVPKTVCLWGGGGEKNNVTWWEMKKVDGKSENQKQLFSNSILC